MEDTSWLTKYRPKVLDEVVGQNAAVKALKNAIAKRSARSFLFTGPSGCGKTTMARITASELGCKPEDLYEIDAATKSGVDNVREVLDFLQYRPLGDGAIKVALVDECHSLSKQAWQALLKSIEEPPGHVVWCLATTEPTKVPDTIKTRCLAIQLKPVAVEVLEDLLVSVAEAEKLSTLVTEDIVVLCAAEAGGSPRQALANLALCDGVQSLEDAAELLRSAADSPQAVDLARLLVNGGGWKSAAELLRSLSDTNPESVRHVVRAYVTKVALGAKSEGQAGAALEILDAFSEPFNSSDGMSPVVLAVGKVLLS